MRSSLLLRRMSVNFACNPFGKLDYLCNMWYYCVSLWLEIVGVRFLYTTLCAKGMVFFSDEESCY